MVDRSRQQQAFVQAFLDLSSESFLDASLPFPDPAGPGLVGAADIRAVISRFSRQGAHTAPESIGLDGANIWIFKFRITWECHKVFMC